jgi:diguanylate cyclase (GGDEF)-like protein
MALNLASSRDALEAREAEVADHAVKLTQILGLARDVGGSLSLRYVLDAVVKATLRVTGAARVLVWTGEDDGLHLARDSGAGVPGISDGGTPSELVERVAADGQLDRADEAAPGGCVLAVPLVFGGQVVGVIDLRGDDLLSLSEDDITVLETLASHSASAIAAARLHGATEALSLTDPLTRLSNRRQLSVDLYTECERSMRYSRPLAFVMLDVDHFKRFNDQHGHQRGDEVLAKFGQLLAETIRVTDSAYRYGGEEFAIVARESTLPEAVALAERLRERIADRFSGYSKSDPITASFGVASGENVSFDPDALIAAADAALYAAKREGRDRVVAAAEADSVTVQNEGSQNEPPLRILRDDS